MSEALLREGVEALRRGDGLTAVDRFEAFSATLGDQDKPWMMLAQAYRMSGNDADEEAALQQVLAVSPRDLAAMLMMGHLKQRQHDDRAASSWYMLALGQAELLTEAPLALRARLEDARAFLQQSQHKFADQLEARLKAAGISGIRRIDHSLDLLLGRSELYVQQPSSFYFPGLPQRQFYEREEFGWLREVEAAVPAMQAELHIIIAEDRDFAPYVEQALGRPAPTNPLLGDPSWGALYFLQNGETVAKNADRAPVTMKALAATPQPKINGRSPIAHYSLLKPGTHIAPHNGMLNTRLICHIPLIAPENCALRVGNETRAWVESEALIFDDSIEHEAWNKSDQTRIILLFEIWRPEISDEERAALTILFEAITDYSGTPVDIG